MLRCAEKEHQSSGFSVITCWTTGDYFYQVAYQI